MMARHLEVSQSAQEMLVRQSLPAMDHLPMDHLPIFLIVHLVLHSPQDLTAQVAALDSPPVETQLSVVYHPQEALAMMACHL